MLNRSERIANRIGTRSASRHNTFARTLELKSNGNVARRHVSNHHRDKERADSRRPFAEEFLVLIMQSLHAADTRADEDARPLAVDVFKSSVVYGKARRRQCKLRVSVHALNFFLVDELRGVEVLNLAGDLGCVIRRVKARDTPNAVCARKTRRPEFFLANANRRDYSQPCDYDSIFLNQINQPPLPAIITPPPPPVKGRRGLDTFLSARPISCPSPCGTSCQSQLCIPSSLARRSCAQACTTKARRRNALGCHERC